MAGSEVDFVDDLIGASFRVNNPNATASCGCGTSFSHLERFTALHAHRHLERQFDQAAARPALTWLDERSPDIVCLQEIKCVDEAFPREAIEALGYNVVTHGQKTFNGVALLSKLPFDEMNIGLAGDDERRPRPLHRRAWSR